LSYFYLICKSINHFVERISDINTKTLFPKSKITVKDYSFEFFIQDKLKTLNFFGELETDNLEDILFNYSPITETINSRCFLIHSWYSESNYQAQEE
jgi:hypothetical protein